jgi:hypothetical protein
MKVALFRMQVVCGNAYLGRKQPFSSVSMRMEVERDIVIGLHDQIMWGPPSGCISAKRRVAVFQAVMEGHSGVPFLRVPNAISRGKCSNWDEERLREATTSTPIQCTLVI